MNKLLSSLFCCSVESKDDSHDKVHNKQSSSAGSSKSNKTNTRSSQLKEGQKTKSKSSQALNTSTAGVTSGVNDNSKRGTKTISNKNDKTKTITGNDKLSKNELLDDEHSINETDTITNTNDESNNTPTSQVHPINNQIDNSSKEIIANQENPAEVPVIPSINEDTVIYAHEKGGDKISNKKDVNKRKSIAEQQQGQQGNTTSLDNEESEDDDEVIPDNDLNEEVDDNSYLDLTKLQEGQAFNPESGWLLGFKDTKKFGNKKCLILDLDETLVHSSFKYLRTADFVIPVEIDNQVHHVYVIKRPGVDEFLQKVGKWYEVVVFTASVSKYGDPLLDKLDFSKSIHHRLFRDSCYNYQGNFIKNLSQVGRPLSDSIIIDNSPASYIFHPQHSIPISSWFSDTHDNELIDLLPFLEDMSKPNVDDVGKVLDITL